jgi:hypothetical protein
MTDKQRERLKELLLDAGGIEGLVELDEVAAHDVDALEPAIDEMVRNAFEAGVELGLRGKDGEKECSAKKEAAESTCRGS